MNVYIFLLFRCLCSCVFDVSALCFGCLYLLQRCFGAMVLEQRILDEFANCDLDA